MTPQTQVSPEMNDYNQLIHMVRAFGSKPREGVYAQLDKAHRQAEKKPSCTASPPAQETEIEIDAVILHTGRMQNNSLAKTVSRAGKRNPRDRRLPRLPVEKSWRRSTTGTKWGCKSEGFKMNDKRFAGKSVLVTGGSRGIGRACALAFARNGADVAINYNKSEDEAKEVMRTAARDSA